MNSPEGRCRVNTLTLDFPEQDPRGEVSCVQGLRRSNTLSSSKRRHFQGTSQLGHRPPPPSSWHLPLLPPSQFLPWWVGLNVHSLLLLLHWSGQWCMCHKWLKLTCRFLQKGSHNVLVGQCWGVSPYSKRVHGSNPGQTKGFFLQRCEFSLCLRGFSPFPPLPQPKNTRLVDLRL